MKYLVFIIFFTVFLGIFFLGSWYVYNRGAQALSETQYGTVFKWVFWILSFSFILGQFLERGTPNALSSVITYIGSFWLVILWYLFLFVVAIDIVRLTNGWWQYIPHNLLSGILKGPNVFVAVMSATLLLVFAGHINALNARIINVDLDIDKPGNGKKELKVALVTDIHMGHIIGNKRVSKLIDQLNKQSPDLVLFGGDLVDHNPLPVIKENMGEHFDRLNPPLGKFAVTGNHEYIGKPDISIDYLSKFGIQYIRDTIVNVNDVLYIIGREDREMPRFNGKNRQNVSKLVNGEAENKLVILMDHQPVEYNSVAKAGIDLMVSGHTHKGQFWPFGMITKRVFELDWGLKKKGNTHFYVSSGYGTWGPPVRIGSRPEIVIFNIKLN
ncbi:MAG: metallophosphoesterase [Salinivirgaceae bacterium]|jgi:predicted MPP superfamily phosphohydrolase|nr:metallophosphoesterase [Salinivirgaceae bacterium]